MKVNKQLYDWMGWFKNLFTRRRTETSETQFDDCPELSTSTIDDGGEVLRREFGLNDSMELTRERVTSHQQLEVPESMTEIAPQNEKFLAGNHRVGRRVSKDTEASYLTQEQTQMANEISDALRQMQEDISGINKGLLTIKFD